MSGYDGTAAPIPMFCSSVHSVRACRVLWVALIMRILLSGRIYGGVEGKVAAVACAPAAVGHAGTCGGGLREIRRAGVRGDALTGTGYP